MSGPRIFHLFINYSSWLDKTRYCSVCPVVCEFFNNLLGLPEVDKLKEFHMLEGDGMWGTVKNGAGLVKERTTDLISALKVLAKNMESVISNLLKIASFVVVTT